MKKRTFAFLLSMAVIASLIIPSFAASVPHLKAVSDDTVFDEGDTFTIEVVLEENPGLGMLQFDVLYDTDVLTCTSVNADEILSQDGVLFAGNEDNEGKASLAAISTAEIKGNGILAKLTFSAKSAGTTSISLNVVRMLYNGTAISAKVSATSIQVTDLEAPSTPDDDPTTEPEPAPAIPSKISFSDVPESHWAYSYIQNAVQNGLFSGIGNGQFGPAMNVTRGMFVTTLYSAAGSPDVELSDFSDVADNAWYAKAVAWASQQGIVSGIGNNKFGPDMPITREQIALILYNYADGVSPGTEAFVRIGYADGKDIHDWALTAFTWAMNKELIAGKSGNLLDPLATATRAEVAVIMQNFVNLTK